MVKHSVVAQKWSKWPLCPSFVSWFVALEVFEVRLLQLDFYPNFWYLFLDRTCLEMGCFTQDIKLWHMVIKSLNYEHILAGCRVAYMGTNLPINWQIKSKVECQYSLSSHLTALARNEFNFKILYLQLRRGAEWIMQEALHISAELRYGPSKTQMLFFINYFCVGKYVQYSTVLHTWDFAEQVRGVWNWGRRGEGTSTHSTVRSQGKCLFVSSSRQRPWCNDVFWLL